MVRFSGVRDTLNVGTTAGAQDRGPELSRGAKTITQSSDPVDAVVRYLVRHPADLIVLATHQRKGRCVG
ncbi:MAG: hypothetical protein IPG58_14870 [Acidobacteria bacterium]|nr:hypothetical protein [Acidobacteriota bacterium]